MQEDGKKTLTESQIQRRKKQQLKKFKRNIFTKRMRRHLLGLVFFFTVLFLALAGHIVRIYLTRGKSYSRKVLTQKNFESISVPFRRGDIYDRNGAVLATSTRVYNLVIEPKNILEHEENRVATEKALKNYFDLTDQELNKYLSDPESLYQVVRKNLPYEKVKNFQNYADSKEGKDVTGVWFEDQYVRNYPNDDLACHVLGFVVGGNEGLGGLEGNYNSELNGEDGRIYAYLSSDGTLQKKTEEATDGNSLITTIDTEAQRIVQNKVEEFESTQMGARNISVLVMNPQNCEILALYNSHQFDPNNAYDISRTKYQYEQENEDTEISDEQYASVTDAMDDKEKLDRLNELWRNFVVSDNFEPGSTYKTFTVSGALEEGIVKPDDTFYCDGGQQVEDKYIRCHLSTGHGELTVTQALGQSCNDVLMQIAAKEGRTIFAKYQDLFGFGQRTNVDLTGEGSDEDLSMMIYHADTLNPVELATSSFGQGVTTTMMQVGTAFCSAINGGFYYQPHVVKQIVDADGNLIQNYDKILVRRTVSRETSQEICQMLADVITEGTGKRAAVAGYAIGGKSGTAEKLPRGSGKYILSFIGFAPVQNPEVMIYCLVDEPDSPDPASSAAGTLLFNQIASELLPYLNIDRAAASDSGVTQNGASGDSSSDEIAVPVTDGTGSAVGTATATNAALQNADQPAGNQ